MKTETILSLREELDAVEVKLEEAQEALDRACKMYARLHARFSENEYVRLLPPVTSNGRYKYALILSAETIIHNMFCADSKRTVEIVYRVKNISVIGNKMVMTDNFPALIGEADIDVRVEREEIFKSW